MLNQAWNFMKRHRHKVFVAGAVTGGLVVAGKLAESRFQMWQTSEGQKMMDRMKRQHHYESTERTANLTLVSLFPDVGQVLKENLDSEALLVRIKTQSGNKLELWHQLKVMALTRAIAGVIVGTQMVLLMKIQLNVLSGYLYCGTLADQSQISSSLQQTFLAVSQGFIERCVPDVCAFILDRLQSLTSLSLKDQFTITQLEALFQTTLLQIDMDHLRKKFMSFHDYWEQKSPPNLDATEIAVFKTLLRDLNDVVEHDDFLHVFKVGIQAGISTLFDLIADAFIANESLHENGSRSELSLPLAKIIPILTKVVANQDVFIQAWISHPLIKQYSANIYESFCQTPSNASSTAFFNLWPF